MNKYLSLSLAGLLFSTACTTPVEKLNPNASSVTVLKDVTLGDLDRLQKLGTGSCEIGSNARSQISNQIACENYLRNEAAKKEAEYLVFTSTTKKGLSTAIVEATFYKRKVSR